jgi:hypothetical protein
MDLYSVEAIADEAMKQGDEALHTSLLQFVMSFKGFMASLPLYSPQHSMLPWSYFF